MANPSSPILGSQTKFYVDFSYTHPASPTYDNVTSAVAEAANEVKYVSDDGDLTRTATTSSTPVYGQSDQLQVPGPTTIDNYTITFITHYSEANHTTVLSKSTGDAVAVGVVSLQGASNADGVCVLIQGKIAKIDPMSQTADGTRSSTLEMTVDSIDHYYKA